MNSYGNFVVQNALKFASQDEKKRLAMQIDKILPNITDPKIKQKWTQLLKRNGKQLLDYKSIHPPPSHLQASSRMTATTVRTRLRAGRARVAAESWAAVGARPRASRCPTPSSNTTPSTTTCTRR